MLVFDCIEFLVSIEFQSNSKKEKMNDTRISIELMTRLEEFVWQYNEHIQ